MRRKDTNSWSKYAAAGYEAGYVFGFDVGQSQAQFSQIAQPVFVPESSPDKWGQTMLSDLVAGLDPTFVEQGWKQAWSDGFLDGFYDGWETFKSGWPSGSSPHFPSPIPIPMPTPRPLPFKPGQWYPPQFSHQDDSWSSGGEQGPAEPAKTGMTRGQKALLWFGAALVLSIGGYYVFRKEIWSAEPMPEVA